MFIKIKFNLFLQSIFKNRKVLKGSENIAIWTIITLSYFSYNYRQTIWVSRR